MPDLPVPDPATRDLLAEAYAAGMRWAVTDTNTATFDAWYATKFPPPLPDEPPDGAICHGADGVLWLRRDDWAGNSRHWFKNGRDSFRYGAAIDEGLQPGRRLVELPDPDDVAEMRDFADDVNRADSGDVAPRFLAIVVRALTERGQK